MARISCTSCITCEFFFLTADLDRRASKYLVFYPFVQGDTKKRELLKNPTKIEEIQEKNLLTEIEPLQLAF